jgi:hypothetical protein
MPPRTHHLPPTALALLATVLLSACRNHEPLLWYGSLDKPFTLAPGPIDGLNLPRQTYPFETAALVLQPNGDAVIEFPSGKTLTLTEATPEDRAHDSDPAISASELEFERLFSASLDLCPILVAEVIKEHAANAPAEATQLARALLARKEIVIGRPLEPSDHMTIGLNPDDLATLKHAIDGTLTTPPPLSHPTAPDYPRSLTLPP